MSQIPPDPPGGTPPPGSPPPPGSTPPPGGTPPGGTPPPGGWGPPQSPYGAPSPSGEGGAGGGSGMSGAVKALIAVAVVAIVAVGAFLVLGGDDDGGDPAAAVRSFFDAAQNRDCEQMISLVSEASWSQEGTVTREEAMSECASEIEDEEFFPAGTTITATEVASQEGDTAQVEVTTSSESLGEQTETIPVVKEDGRWVVDFASQEVGGSSPPEAEAPDAGPAEVPDAGG